MQRRDARRRFHRATQLSSDRLCGPEDHEGGAGELLGTIRSRRVIRNDQDQDQERKVRVDYFSLSSHAVSPESLSSQFVL
jgi:hypothetical protein